MFNKQKENKEIPLPPVEMRRFVGPTNTAAFDNPEHKLIFSNIQEKYYASVFDFGCGCGRIARQLIQQNPIPKKYIGVDINLSMITWCKENLSPFAPNFTFFHQDTYNAGLNPNGKKEFFSFPTEDKSTTLFIAHSVFTHVSQSAAEFYLKELSRILAQDGIAYTTWFIFDKTDFPMMQEFQNAIFINDQDTTNAVIFDKKWLMDTCDTFGLTIKDIVPPRIKGFQWNIFLAKKVDGDKHCEFPLDLAPKGIERPPYDK